MKRCGAVRSRLSELLDGELDAAEARAVAAHLQTCLACARHEIELRRVCEAVAQLPRLLPSEPIADAIRQRLDLENRGPGLAMLFRSFWAARPLILPSLASALVVLLTALAGTVALDRLRQPASGALVAVGAGQWRGVPATGTEGNPLFPTDDVSLPREQESSAFPDAVLTRMVEGSLFVETVVARDGSVSDVRVLGGDRAGSGDLVDALLKQRFEPGRYNGRPVAVSVYRLISHLEVRALESPARVL